MRVGTPRLDDTIGVVAQRRVPEGSHIVIKFGNDASFSEGFADRSESYRPATTKGLNEILRPWLDGGKPSSNVWNQPSLAARVAQRRTLGHRSHVGRGDR